MARITVQIEADSMADLAAAMAGLGSSPVPAETTKRTRGASKERGDAAGSAPASSNGGDAPTPPAVTDDPDLAAPPPPAPTTTATPEPKYPTPDSFIDAVKKLLGRGKDDAVRAKLKELGYERVRDVPADKYEATLVELGKV